jgi:hypothetical protein
MMSDKENPQMIVFSNDKRERKLQQWAWEQMKVLQEEIKALRTDFETMSDGLCEHACLTRQIIDSFLYSSLRAPWVGWTGNYICKKCGRILKPKCSHERDEYERRLKKE